MIKTEKCGRVEVSQRLKRVPTILDKLIREPTMALNTMRDIGGCRAVLDSVEQVRRVEARLKKNRDVVDYNDYITEPRSSGYRSVHVTVLYDDRRIEVQLRTEVMHQWAYSVERFSGRLGEDLKSGIGPEPVLDWLRSVSAAMAIEESGGVVGPEMMSEISGLRALALPYLEGGRP